MQPIVSEKIETQRLIMRTFLESDWDSLSDMLGDEESVRYTIKTPLTKWQTWRTLATYIGHWQLRGYGPYALIEKASNGFVGLAGLWYPGDWPEPEIKYSLVKSFWGNGFATEAAMAIKNSATHELKRDRLISLILPQNEASKAVARRIGGTFEKTIPFRDGVADMFAYKLR